MSKGLDLRSLVAMVQIRSLTRHPGSYFYFSEMLHVIEWSPKWESLGIGLSFWIFC